MWGGEGRAGQGVDLQCWCLNPRKEAVLQTPGCPQRGRRRPDVSTPRIARSTREFLAPLADVEVTLGSRRSARPGDIASEQRFCRDTREGTAGPSGRSPDGGAQDRGREADNRRPSGRRTKRETL